MTKEEYEKRLEQAKKERSRAKRALEKSKARSEFVHEHYDTYKLAEQKWLYGELSPGCTK